MAIVKMRKLNLIAMSYDKDAILDALQRTGAVEITTHADTANTVVPVFDCEETRTKLASTENALYALCKAVDDYTKAIGEKTELLKDGFDVSYSEFVAAKAREQEVEDAVAQINAFTDEKNTLTGNLAGILRQKRTASVYSILEQPFQAFGDTSHTRGRLGIVSVAAKENLQAALDEQPLCAYQLLNVADDEALFFVSTHKSVASETDAILSAFAFSDCPYSGEKSGKQTYREFAKEEERLQKQLQENVKATYELREQIRPLKIYCDYLSFVLEKEETSDKLRATECTFLLEAYLPFDAEETVKQALQTVTKAVYADFSDPTDEDTPPTLLRNNRLVENFEPITNTYSAPHYREFDPNAVMAFFYSLLMGFIIGDAGYGLVMALAGGWLWGKGRLRPTGLSRLAGAFAFGGVFAVIWGALFNSFFGFPVFGTGNSVMPDPQKDLWSLAGIDVPSVLIISMEIGIVQLFTGYVCRAVQEWRRGNVADGIFDGIVWAVFSIGVGLAIVGFVDEANLPILATVGGITAGGALLVAMLTAGRKEKFVGKLTKGFGSVYGIINYASDILSYARLYGLMLSGAVIAQIIANYSGGFILSGNALLVVLGVLLLVVGNAFNLVMNLLGAYIHDARLQYVEFYGRFFEGDGELFSPLGSKHKYIYLVPEKQA